SGHRSTLLDEHPVLARDCGNLIARGRSVGSVDVDRVAEAEAETLEPTVQALGLTRSERATGSRCVEHIVGGRDDRDIYRGKPLVRKTPGRRAARRDCGAEGD